MLRRQTLILLFTLTVFTFYEATPQDTLVSKAYIQTLEERLNRLESSSGTNGLSEERLELLNDKIENLQSETERSATNVSNEIAATSTNVTVILGVWSVLFALAGIAIAAFVNSQQGKSAKNLEESKAVLATQRSIENEVINAKEAMQAIQGNVDAARTEVTKTREEVKQTLHLIENNLTELYIKLQAEEVNFLIDQIYKDPNLMYQLFDRFLVLRLNEKHFEKLVKFIVDKAKGQSDNTAGNSVFSVIFNQFPKKWLDDVRLKRYFVDMNNWIRIIGQYEVENLKNLIDILIDYRLENAPDKTDYKVGSVYLEQARRLYKEMVATRSFPPEVRDSLPDKGLTKHFYNKLSRKELKFDMYNELRHYSCGFYFWKLLSDEYDNDETNTDDQKYLLDICRGVYVSHPDNV